MKEAGSDWFWTSFSQPLVARNHEPEHDAPEKGFAVGNKVTEFPVDDRKENWQGVRKLCMPAQAPQ